MNDQIQRAGRRLRWTTTALILLTPIAVVALLLLKGPLGFVKVPREIAIDATQVDLPAALAIIAVGLLTPVTYLVGLLLLHRLFGLFARGIVFTAETVLTIRRAGYVLIAIDIVAMLQSALTGVVLTSFSITERHIAIDLQSSMLIVGLFVVLISRVMQMGCDIHERDRLTI